MASVYKSLSKTNGHKEEAGPANGVKKNKQRVLILSSRGITYRYVFRRNNGEGGIGRGGVQLIAE